MSQPTGVPEEHLAEALEKIDVEQSIITAEIEAFESFLDRVGSISTTQSGGIGMTAVDSHAGNHDSFQSLRRAYESTVMSLDHYETEYGESFSQSLRAEFGPDIATLLTTGQIFERHHKQAVIVACEDAIDRRGRLAAALTEERTSIERLQEPVRSVITTLERLDTAATARDGPKLLDGYSRRVDVLTTRCHDLIDQRQSEIVDDRRALSLPISGPDMPSYLYTDLPVTYPVVAPLTKALESAASVSAAIETERSARS